MTDTRKFRITIIIAISLSILALAYNAAQEYVATEIGGYLKRRAYYEGVISKKGLSMQRGTHWKKHE